MNRGRQRGHAVKANAVEDHQRRINAAYQSAVCYERDQVLLPAFHKLTKREHTAAHQPVLSASLYTRA